MYVNGYNLSEKKRTRGKGDGKRGFGIFYFVENIDKNLMARWKESEKAERERDQERILKSMVVQSGENVPFYLFSILILFSCSMMFANYDEI